MLLTAMVPPASLWRRICRADGGLEVGEIGGDIEDGRRGGVFDGSDEDTGGLSMARPTLFLSRLVSFGGKEGLGQF